MSLQINRSFAANSANALQAYHTNQTTMGKAITRVSTGKRVNTAADDVSAYIAGRKLQTDTEGYNALYKGVQNGATYLNAAQGAMSSINDMLQSMKSTVQDYSTLTDKSGSAATELGTKYTNLLTAVKAAMYANIGGNTGLISDGPSNFTFQTALASSNSNSSAPTTNLLELNATTESSISYSVKDADSITAKDSSFNMATGGQVKINNNIYKLESSTYNGGTLTPGNFEGMEAEEKDLKDWHYITNAGIKSLGAGQSGIGLWRLNDNGTADNFDDDRIDIRWVKTDGNPFVAGVEGADSATSTVALTGSVTESLKLTTTNSSFGISDTTLDSNNVLTSALISVDGNTYKLLDNNNIYLKSDDKYTTSVGTWEYGSNNTVINLNWNAVGSTSSDTGSFNVNWDGLKTAINNLSGAVSDAEALNNISSAMTVVSTNEAKIGAGVNTLAIISDHLSNMSTIMDNSYTALTESDMAEEMTKYVKSNIYAQAAQAMIAQANQSMAQVLNLLQ